MGQQAQFIKYRLKILGPINTVIIDETWTDIELVKIKTKTIGKKDQKLLKFFKKKYTLD